MELRKAHTPQTPIFAGYFIDWTSACEASNNSRQGLNVIAPFDSDRWMTRQYEMLASARKGIYPRPSNLPKLAAHINSKFILDFGGGSGWTAELVADVGEDNFESYVVLEIPSVCREFSRVFTPNSGVSFISSVSDVPYSMASHTDILYSNSVLQYFPDNSKLVEIVSSLSPNYILLDDVQTSTSETFYTLQNYYGISIPYRFSNFEQFVKTCLDLGYELQQKSDFSSPIATGMVSQIQGAGKGLPDIGSSLSLLFKRVN